MTLNQSLPHFSFPWRRNLFPCCTNICPGLSSYLCQTHWLSLSLSLFLSSLAGSHAASTEQGVEQGRVLGSSDRSSSVPPLWMGRTLHVFLLTRDTEREASRRELLQLDTRCGWQGPTPVRQPLSKKKEKKKKRNSTVVLLPENRRTHSESKQAFLYKESLQEGDVTP